MSSLVRAIKKLFDDDMAVYAAALSVILIATVLLLTLLIFRSARSWVHYEGGPR